MLDLFTDEIVCEYTGRDLYADDFYETVRRVLLFYNAECNYENNKKGLFKYFSQHNCLYLLSDTLDFLKDKDDSKPAKYGNKVKGTNASVPVQNYGRRAIRDYLLKTKTEVVEEDGEIVTKTFTMIDTINYRALLQELSYWNCDGNFDRHDALLMLMLLREEKMRLYGGDSPEGRLNETKHKGLEVDDFFSKNYKSRNR